MPTQSAAQLARRAARTRVTRRSLSVVTAATVILSLVGIGAPSVASAAGSCAQFAAPIYQTINPRTNANLLTASAAESTGSRTKYGFSDDRGVIFNASSTANAVRSVSVHRMYRKGDFKWAVTQAQIDAGQREGYELQKTDFRAANVAGSGCVAFSQFAKNGKHRIEPASRASGMQAAGWANLGILFYAAPQPETAALEPAEFTIAVFGDTQSWVHGKESKFSEATAWLAKNAKQRNLKYVLHTGDITNWGWLAPDQMDNLDRATANLERANIPYQFTLGNHDTRAVGWNGVSGSRSYGGSAYTGNPECIERLSAAECKTNRLVRKTQEFNQRLNATDSGANGGQFEPGKVDNAFSTFSAGGRQWLTLTLEFAPRESVVAWAGNVLERYPDHNVIIQTHHYLQGESISSSNGGYGESSPQYVFDNLVEKYKNVRFVFSGHTGTAGTRIDRGVHGNTIVSMLHNEVNGEDRDNPFRLVTINGDTGAVKSTIYGPRLNRTYSSYDATWTMQWQG